MENPANWGPAEKIINKAYQQWWDASMKGVIGGSLAYCITTALKEADLLSDVPLKLDYHKNWHDGFDSLCKFCDWEREHNDYYPDSEWKKEYENP